MQSKIEAQNAHLLADAAVAETSPAPQETFDFAKLFDGSRTHRLVPMLAGLAVILTLVFIPLKILSIGYLPSDDALRHAAKAVSGREWSEVIVLQDQFKQDHSPGWHWILGVVHQVTGAGPDVLVMMSVCALLLGFTIAPLAWIKRPEAWVAALLLSMVIFPSMLLRFYLARPFVFTATATMVLLLMWRKREKPSMALLAGSTALFALAAWIHGSWYLFALVIASFGFAGQWRSALYLAGCWLGGSLLGALLTGHPIAFLWNAINIGINCFGQHDLQRMLVAEFQPNDGAPMVILLTAILISVRVVTGRWTWDAVRNPIFILFVLGWIAGFRVTRFWEDWGLPAFALWIALELQEHIDRSLSAQTVRRLIITGGLCVALFFAVTGDVGGRWTNLLSAEYLQESDPEMDAWLPEDGGVLYHANMRVFYLTYFKNPHAKWKYVLGFEPAFMQPDDLKIYRNIQWNSHSYAAYEPWAAKMKPEDRLVISTRSSVAPTIPGLEWKYVARELWVGRLPRPVEQAAAHVSTESRF